MQKPQEDIEKEVLKEIRSEKRKKKNENEIYTSFFETDSFILEQIQHPIINNNAGDAVVADGAEENQFLFYSKTTGSVDYLTQFEWHGKTIYPITGSLLDAGVVLLPSGIEEYGDTSTLVAEIHDFLYENFEVPMFYEKFLPYLALFSWVYDRFPFVPYVHFIGLTGTGKTTAAEAFMNVCYKPIDAAGAITMSPIFRTAKDWRGTLFLDEFEPEGDGYKEMISFLKSGVGNRAVLRTEGEKNREVIAYLIKSMKIFTSERPINNAGLRSRMFVIQMEKNTRKIPLIKLKRFTNTAMKLRNKLLLWRLRNLDKIDLSELEYGYPELQTFDRRVQQVLTPVYYLSDEKARKTIVEFASVQEEETKRERLESIEGEIFQAIYDYYSEKRQLQATIDPPLTAISEKINADRTRRPTTEKRIANIVRQVLQFDVEQQATHEKARVVLISEKMNRFTDLQTYFGYGDICDENSSASPAKTEVACIDAINGAGGSAGDTQIDPAPDALPLDENGVPTENPF